MTNKTLFVAVVLTATLMTLITGVLFELGADSTQANVKAYVMYAQGY